jgi:non-ribosomal peptide synthetase component F
MLRRALSISRHSRYLRRNFRGIATGSVSAFLVQGPRRPFPKNARVSDLMEQQANATPALPAVAYGDKVLSFEQLADRVQCVANSLVQAGVTAGMHVGALFSRSEMTVVVMAALFKVGAVYVPLDESYPLSRIASMISGGAVSIILADEANVDKIPGEYGGRVLLLTDLRPALATAASQISGRGEDAAYVVFTSGSTGPPKAITLNHTSLVTSITGVNEDDVAFLRGVRTWVCAAATSFTVSLLEIWGAVCSGRLAYITPTMKLDPDWYTVSVLAVLAPSQVPINFPMACFC